MTYNEAKNAVQDALSESSHPGLPPVVVLRVLDGLVKELERLRGYTEVLQERIAATEKGVGYTIGANVALKSRVDMLEDAFTTPRQP
jgi:hypothetical protein